MPRICKIYQAAIVDSNDERVRELLKQLREWKVTTFWFQSEESGVMEVPKLIENLNGVFFTAFTWTFAGVSYEDNGYACGVDCHYGEYIGGELLTPLIKERKVALEYVAMLC